MVQNLTKTELLYINGGHNGESYEAGVAIGRFISKAGTFLSTRRYSYIKLPYNEPFLKL